MSDAVEAAQDESHSAPEEVSQAALDLVDAAPLDAQQDAGSIGWGEDQVDAESGDLSASERHFTSYASLPPRPGVSTSGAADNERPVELPRSASRLSRPNSAQIATLIEGYHDDFIEMQPQDSEDVLQEVLQSEVAGQVQLPPEEPSETSAPDSTEDSLRPSLAQWQAKIAQAKAEQEDLLGGNERLQRQIRSVLDLRRKGPAEDENMLGTAEARYASLCTSLEQQKQKLASMAAKFDRTVEELRQELQERLTKTTQVQNALRYFMVEVGKGCECARTGKPINEKLVEKMHRKDVAKEEKLVSLRLKNIELRHKLERLEATVREKEQLAEGLHLIDFEQLKIENQSLTEKIEERNEELLKLKRKITMTVQILTHMREKLQFILRRNRVLTKDVSHLDSELGTKRDSLSKLRQRRDSLRQTATKIKETSVYINNPLLLNDMQAQARLRDSLVSEIEDLNERKAAVAASVADMTAQITGLTEELGGAADTASVQVSTMVA